MIIVDEKNDDFNVLHIIVGPETEDQFNFYGQAVMDITDYISNLDPGKPVKLIVNPCSSETEIIQMLNMKQQQKVITSFMEKLQEGIQEMGDDSIIPIKQKETRSTRDSSKHGIKCPLCLKDNGAIIKDGIVYPCPTCQEIENGLKAKETKQIPNKSKRKSKSSCENMPTYEDGDTNDQSKPSNV